MNSEHAGAGRKWLVACLIIGAVIGALFAIAYLNGLSLLGNTAKITYEVVGDHGKPIPGAWIRAGFMATDRPTLSLGVTDSAGLFTVRGTCDGEAGATTGKQGYYESTSVNYQFTRGFRYEPWNPVVPIILRKIENPVPMYARRFGDSYVKNSVPANDADLGFDLVVGDWVAPYGRGVTSDFIFKASQRYDGPQDFELKVRLRFSNPGDGIQSLGRSTGDDYFTGSQFRFPYHAPTEGYLPAFENSFNPRSADDARGPSYVFRVRTLLNEKGEVVSALYGKIDGEIEVKFPTLSEVKPNSGVAVKFTYYLNPDGTTNLEFDTKRNLAWAPGTTKRDGIVDP